MFERTLNPQKCDSGRVMWPGSRPLRENTGRAVWRRATSPARRQFPRERARRWPTFMSVSKAPHSGDGLSRSLQPLCLQRSCWTRAAVWRLGSGRATPSLRAAVGVKGRDALSINFKPSRNKPKVEVKGRFRVGACEQLGTAVNRSVFLSPDWLARALNRGRAPPTRAHSCTFPLQTERAANCVHSLCLHHFMYS